MAKYKKPTIGEFRKALAEDIESLRSSDINKYVQLLKIQQQAGNLVDRRLAEAVIERYTGELCKRLSDTTRQIINLAGVGKTREEKLELETSITNLIDATLRAFQRSMVIPDVDCSGLNSRRAVKDMVDMEVRKVQHTRERGTRMGA